MFGHVEVEDSPALVGEDDQDEEHAQARGGEAEEIEGDQVLDAVGEERAPGLGRRGMPHARAGISGGAEPALLGRDGAWSGQGVRSPSATDAPPTGARQRQRGEDDHPGTGKPGTGPD